MSFTQSTPIDVVVPCYNPLPKWEQNLVNCFLQLQNECKAQLNLIVVNDGSTLGVADANVEFIKKSLPRFTYHSYTKNKGKGYALRTGIKLSKADHCLVTDIDFPYTNQSMVNVVHSLLQHHGLIIGHRKADYYQKVPFFRRSLSKAFRLSLKLFLKIEVNDTQCGLKAMGLQAKQLFLKTKVNGYLYDLEHITLIEKNKIPVSRVTVELKDGIQFTNMKPKILIKEFTNFMKIIANNA